MERQDDYQQRRKHLAKLSEEQLEQRFWELAASIVEPLVEQARSHTSPAIERSVLLRMGFSSLEGTAIVNGCLDRGLLGKGAGHVVLRLSRAEGTAIREAGLALAAGRGWETVEKSFGGAL
ncbi:MAG: ornithine aminomutase subunit alpha [Xanthomonadales bacterium]|jgi:D-ornithine 4,5-aminomutase subunit alpha|nr:ornithine aminomutase subunit alpha [Xanthomonadales bacterium]